MQENTEKEPQADQDKPWQDYTLGEMAEALKAMPGDGNLRKKLIQGLMNGAGVEDWCLGMIWAAHRPEGEGCPELTVYRGDSIILQGLVENLREKITKYRDLKGITDLLSG
jgi:hypothetical protein